MARPSPWIYEDFPEDDPSYQLALSELVTEQENARRDAHLDRYPRKMRPSPSDDDA